MKKYIIKTLFCIVIAISAFSCKQQDVNIFDTPGGVYFIDTLWTYSFVSDIEAKSSVVNIQVELFGKTAPIDRPFKVELLSGDEMRVSTLPTDKYEILECIIPADSTYGYVPIKVDYYDEMDTSVKLLFINVVASDVFPNVYFKSKKMRLEVTNTVIQPGNWNSQLRYYFGMYYSTGWWRFILKAINRTDLPYWPSNKDKETWYMDDYEFNANVDLVRNALDKYNADHPKDKLKHDDGPKKNEEITM